MFGYGARADDSIGSTTYNVNLIYTCAVIKCTVGCVCPHTEFRAAPLVKSYHALAYAMLMHSQLLNQRAWDAKYSKFN